MMMPAMPNGNPWVDIQKLFVVEDAIRSGGAPAVGQALSRLDDMSPYWADVGRLFGIYALTRGYDGPRERLREVADLRRAMESDFYAAYIRKRSKKLSQVVARLDFEAAIHD